MDCLNCNKPLTNMDDGAYCLEGCGTIWDVDDLVMLLEQTREARDEERALADKRQEKIWEYAKIIDDLSQEKHDLEKTKQ